MALTDDQIKALNEWARTQPSLRGVFPYTNLQGLERDQVAGEVGLGDLIDNVLRPGDVITGRAFYTLSGGEVFPGASITDHGALTGLTDDDHPQYARLANSGGNTFTGPITAEAFYVASGGEFSFAGLIDPDNLTISAGNNLTASSGIDLTLSAGDDILIDAADRIDMTGEFIAIGDGSADIFLTLAHATNSLYFGTVAGGEVESYTDDFRFFNANSNLIASVGRDGISVEDKVVAEAFYIEGAGNIYNDGSGNTIIDPGTGNYTQAISNFIAGNPGFEGDSISVNGTTYTSALKVSDISNEDLALVHLHKHSGANLPAVIIGSRSDVLGSSHADVDDNDRLLDIIASGRVGSTYEVAGSLRFLVDGTPSTGILPGEIQFRVNNGTDQGVNPDLAMAIRSGAHIRMENTLEVENQITAEAFYLKSGGEIAPTEYLHIDGSNAMTGTLSLASGSVTAPSLEFSSDTLATGIYRISNNIMGITASNNEVARFSLGAVQISGALTITSTTTAGNVRHGVGSVTFPSITFDDDRNTGLWRPNTDTLGFTTGGNQSALLGHNGFFIKERVQAEAFYIADGGEFSHNKTTIYHDQTPQHVEIYSGPDGMPYCYDPTRDKYLSVGRTTVCFNDRSTSLGGNQFISCAGGGNQSGFRLPRDATVTAMTAHVINVTVTDEVNIDLYESEDDNVGSATPITLAFYVKDRTIPSAELREGLNYDVPRGRSLICRVNDGGGGGTINRPNVTLELAWRDTSKE